jgi:hypothetical protein
VLAFSAPLVVYRFEYFQVLLGIVLAVIGVHEWWTVRHLRKSGGSGVAPEATHLHEAGAEGPEPAPDDLGAGRGAP